MATAVGDDLKEILKQYTDVKHDGTVMINGRRRSRRALKPVTRFSTTDNNENMTDDYDASDYDSDESEDSIPSDDNDSDYDPEAGSESDDDVVMAVDVQSEDESEESESDDSD